MKAVGDSVLIHYKIANALASLVLATRSYTVLDRLANAISSDAVSKAIYELGRSLDVIIRNPKEGQKIQQKDKNIWVEGWHQKKVVKFEFEGKLPNELDYHAFIEEASNDVRIARETAAYAAGLVASQISRTLGQTQSVGEEQ